MMRPEHRADCPLHLMVFGEPGPPDSTLCYICAFVRDHVSDPAVARWFLKGFADTYPRDRRDARSANGSLKSDAYAKLIADRLYPPRP